jgi:hypothetical protein
VRALTSENTVKEEIKMPELTTYKYYLNKFNAYNPYYLNALQEQNTKAEIKSLKDQFIDDIKKQEYPKGITKQIVTYIRNL